MLITNNSRVKDDYLISLQSTFCQGRLCAIKCLSRGGNNHQFLCGLCSFRGYQLCLNYYITMFFCYIMIRKSSICGDLTEGLVHSNPSFPPHLTTKSPVTKIQLLVGRPMWLAKLFGQKLSK